MLGCFNPTLGQIWTNPAVGLNFLHYIFNPTFRVCPYLTQNWVKTTQHFLECDDIHKLSAIIVYQCIDVLW